MQRNWRERLRPRKLLAETLPPTGALFVTGDAIRRAATTPHSDARLILGEFLLGSSLPVLSVVAHRRYERQAKDYRNLELLGNTMAGVYRDIITERVFPDELMASDGLTLMFVRSAASLALADIVEEAVAQAPKSSMLDKLRFANSSARKAIEREIQIPQGALEQVRGNMPEADFVATLADLKGRVRGAVEQAALRPDGIPAVSLMGVASVAVSRLREQSPKVGQAAAKSLSRRTLREKLGR